MAIGFGLENFEDFISVELGEKSLMYLWEGGGVNWFTTSSLDAVFV